MSHVFIKDEFSEHNRSTQHSSIFLRDFHSDFLGPTLFLKCSQTGLDSDRDYSLQAAVLLVIYGVASYFYIVIEFTSDNSDQDRLFFPDYLACWLR